MNNARQHGMQHGKHSILLFATIYKLDLQGIFTAAMFGNKLKCRNTRKQENHYFENLSINKATHENTLFTLAVFSTENI
jgi:hypothetical protein